jgi:hypothetical protein
MNDLIITLIVGYALLVVIYGLGLHGDRVVVSLMRRLGIHAFPLAINIAMLIMQHPEQWSSDPHRMSHPKVGSIWIANETYGIKIDTPFGHWKPNVIERRIIRDAVDWRLTTFLRDRIMLTMQDNSRRTLQG